MIVMIVMMMELDGGLFFVRIKFEFPSFFSIEIKFEIELIQSEELSYLNASSIIFWSRFDLYRD